MNQKNQAPKQVFGPNILDVRVRERYISNGLLDPKVLEKHLGELVDSADRVETLDLQQPALGDEDDDETDD